MNKSEYDKLYEFSFQGGGFIPANGNAVELMHRTSIGEILTFEEKTNRDINFHRAYFSMINYIWNWLPEKFKENIPQDKFYYFLKHLKGEYDVIFEFKDGTKLVEYTSLAFGKMSQKTFEEYISNQLPWIYENIVGKFYEGEKYDFIIDNIEEEYKKFLSKLP